MALYQACSDLDSGMLQFNGMRLAVNKKLLGKLRYVYKDKGDSANPS